MEDNKIAIKAQIDALRDERRYLAHLRTLLDNKYDRISQKRGDPEELKEIDEESEKHLKQIHEIDKKIEVLESQLKLNTNRR